MSQAAKAQEPSMEEILASIRRIIADDDSAKPSANAPEAAAAVLSLASPAKAPEAAPPAEPPAMNQDEIDAMLSGFDGPEPEPPPSGDESAEVLELTEAMTVRSSAHAPFRPIEPSLDIVFSDPRAAQHSPEPVMRAGPEKYAAACESEQRLLSDGATSAISSAFGTLAHTVLAQNARTLDDLVREMLRPMLKTWLDDNLPNIVERLVRAEIERVSRGRG